MTAPLADLGPTIFLQKLDQFSDLHFVIESLACSRITFGLTGAPIKAVRRCRRGAFRGPLEPIVRGGR
jgi:hypothetical protein